MDSIQLHKKYQKIIKNLDENFDMCYKTSKKSLKTRIKEVSKETKKETKELETKYNLESGRYNYNEKRPAKDQALLHKAERELKSIYQKRRDLLTDKLTEDFPELGSKIEEYTSNKLDVHGRLGLSYFRTDIFRYGFNSNNSFTPLEIVELHKDRLIESSGLTNRSQSKLISEYLDARIRLKEKAQNEIYFKSSTFKSTQFGALACLGITGIGAIALANPTILLAGGGYFAGTNLFGLATYAVDKHRANKKLKAKRKQLLDDLIKYC